MVMDLSLYDFSRFRKKISEMLSRATNGEVNDIDFFITYHRIGRDEITILLGVPGDVKKKYGGNMSDIITKHRDTIEQVLSSFGFKDLISNNSEYQVL